MQNRTRNEKGLVGKIVLALVIFTVLIIGGCTILLGGAVNEVDKAIKEDAKNDVPTEVTEGKPFEHDYMSVEGGWSIEKERFGGLTIKNLKMTNNSDENQFPSLTFKLYKGKENLGEIDCSANEVQAGETSGFDCISMDSKAPEGWDTIKVADTF